MFKNILKIMAVVVVVVGFVKADMLEFKDNVNGIDVSMKSVKSVVVGSNKFFITLSKDGKAITDAKVKVKFFMPEMPGMPYMDSKQNAKVVDGKYVIMSNFSMSGTWQYQIKFKTQDGAEI